MSDAKPVRASTSTKNRTQRSPSPYRSRIDQSPAEFVNEFWQHTINTAENTEDDFKHQALPLARIKKVMKSDPEVRMISSEVTVLFEKACQIFIQELTARSHLVSLSSRRRTLSRPDVAQAVSKSDMFDFLIDIIPREEAAAWDTGVAEGSKGRGKGKGKGKGKARGRPKKKRTIEEVEEEPERGGSPGGADGEGEGEDDDEDDTGHREKRSRIDVEGDDAQHPSVLNGNGAARLELPPVAPPGDLQVGNAEVAELDKAQRQMYLMQQYQRQNGGSPQSEALNGQQQFGQPASGLAWTASPYGYNMVPAEYYQQGEGDV